MRIRVGNDIRIIIKLYSDDKQINFQSVSAFLYNTTQERIRKEKEEKINRFIGRFPKEPFSNIYSPTEYNINCIGNHYHVKPFVKVYNGFGVKPDWKDIYGCHVPPTSRRVEVFFREKKNEIELRFPACWQLGEGDYSITVIGEVFDPGFNDNNLRTIVYDYKDVFTLVDKSYGADEFDGNIYVNFGEGDGEDNPGDDTPTPDEPTPDEPTLNPISTKYSAFQYEDKWYVVEDGYMIYVEVLDGDTGEYVYTGWPLVAQSNREGYVTIYTDGDGHMDVGRTTTNDSSVYEEFAGQFGYGTDTVNYDNDSLPAVDIQVILAPAINPTITEFGFIHGHIGDEELLIDQSQYDIIGTAKVLQENPGSSNFTQDGEPYTGDYFIYSFGEYPLGVLENNGVRALNISLTKDVSAVIFKNELYVFNGSEGVTQSSNSQNPVSFWRNVGNINATKPRQVVKVFAAEFSDGSCRPVKLNTYYWYKDGLSADKYNTVDYMDINVGDDNGEQFITAKTVSGGFVSISYNLLINLKNNTDLNFDDYVGVQDYDDVIYFSKLTQEAQNKIDISERKITLASILTPKHVTSAITVVYTLNNAGAYIKEIGKSDIIHTFIGGQVYKMQLKRSKSYGIYNSEGLIVQTLSAPFSTIYNITV